MQSYILVYTDGSFHKNIGVGACVIPYFSNYFYLSGSVASPYEAQLLAVVLALKILSEFKLHLVIDNPEVVKFLVDVGWEIDNKYGFKDWISGLTYQDSPLADQIKVLNKGKVTYVKSHTGILGNQLADKFARRGLGVALTKAENIYKNEENYPSLIK